MSTAMHLYFRENIESLKGLIGRASNSVYHDDLKEAHLLLGWVEHRLGFLRAELEKDMGKSDAN